MVLYGGKVQMVQYHEVQYTVAWGYYHDSGLPCTDRIVQYRYNCNQISVPYFMTLPLHYQHTAATPDGSTLIFN